MSEDLGLPFLKKLSIHKFDPFLDIRHVCHRSNNAHEETFSSPHRACTQALSHIAQILHLYDKSVRIPK